MIGRTDGYNAALYNFHLLTPMLFDIYFTVREEGKVIEVTDCIAKVSIAPNENCRNCPASYFCHPLDSIRVIEAENTVNAHIDDIVYIEIPVRSGFVAIFLLFGLPVLLALIGLLIGARHNDTISIVFGVAGFAFGLVFAKILNDRLGAKHRFLPRIIEIIGKKSS